MLKRRILYQSLHLKKLTPLNLTKKEKLHLLIHYPNKNQMDIFDFEGFFTDGSFY